MRLVWNCDWLYKAVMTKYDSPCLMCCVCRRRTTPTLTRREPSYSGSRWTSWVGSCLLPPQAILVRLHRTHNSTNCLQTTRRTSREHKSNPTDNNTKNISWMRYKLFTDNSDWKHHVNMIQTIHWQWCNYSPTTFLCEYDLCTCHHTVCSNSSVSVT